MFRPAAKGKALTFVLTGVRGDNLVMQDEQTHSHWQQATGQAFDGPLRGERLPLVPFVVTSWAKWRLDHPETLAIVPNSADQSNYQRMEQHLGEPFWETQPASGALRLDPRLPAHTMMIGLEVGSAHKAYPIETVQEERVINDQVGAVPVLVVYAPSTDTLTAFSRQVAGNTLTFKSAAGENLTDTETGSVWNTDGQCLSGKLQGRKLDFITPLPGFWFAWAEFHPDTQIYGP